MNKLVTTAVACLALALSGSMAHAQPKEGKRKSAGTATALAVAGTLLPAGLMAAGMGTVFLSLAEFFVLIALLKKFFKNGGSAENSPRG